MIEGAVPECQQTLGGMMGAARLVTKEVGVKDEDEVMEVVYLTEQAASPGLCSRVAQVMRKMRKGMFPVCLFLTVYLKRHVDGHELTHGEVLLDSVSSVVNDLPYNVRSVVKTSIFISMS